MAIWSVSHQALTPVVVSDSSNFTSGGFFCLQGGTTTQLIKIWEIYLGGQATTSTVNNTIVARDSTVGSTLSSGTGCIGTPVALHPGSAALAVPAIGFDTATTKPQRSSTLQLLQPSFNAYGGIVKWNPAEGKEPSILGNTASLGELSISNKAGTGPFSLHILHEPM